MTLFLSKRGALAAALLFSTALVPAEASETKLLRPSTAQPVYGTDWTVGVQVRPTDGEEGSLNGGIVELVAGDTVIDSEVLADEGGVATATFTVTGLNSLPAGSHQVFARFRADLSAPGFESSQSKAAKITVRKAKTATKATLPASRVVFGAQTTLTATVTSSQSQLPPAGTATFYDGQKKLGTAPVVDGSATFTTTKLAYGDRPIRVRFDGSNFGYSLSPFVTTSVGLATGPESVVNVARPGNQTDPTVAYNPLNGQALVVWATDTVKGGQYGIVGRLIDSTGTPVGNEILIRTDRSNKLAKPVVTFAGSGNYVVAYEAYESGDSGDRNVEARALNALGVLLPTGQQPGRVNQTFAGDQHSPTIAFTYWVSGLSAVVAWADSADNTVKARLYDDTLPAQFTVAEAVDGPNAAPSIVLKNERNEFLVSWVGSNKSAPMAFYQQIKADGGKIGKAVRPKTTMFSIPTTTAVLPMTNGRILLGWDERSAASRPERNPYLAIFSASGKRRGNIVNIPVPNAGDQYDPAFAVLSPTRYGVAWADSTNGGIWFQTFNDNGSRILGRARVDDPALNIPGSADTGPAVAPVGPLLRDLSTKSFVVAWTSEDGTEGKNIHIQTMAKP